jgi:5-methylcytosine-specific restriction endonuclease McrA
MSQVVKSYYGKVVMPRAKCSECHAMSFVEDGMSVCCGADVDTDVVGSKKQMTQGRPHRRHLPGRIKQTILEAQEGKCFYCQCDLSSTWYISPRMKTPRRVRTEFDHLLPFAFCNDQNTSNFVAACNVCNRIKYDRVFDSVEKLVSYIEFKRGRLGYQQE